jgi:hypothetical protein
LAKEVHAAPESYARPPACDIQPGLNIVAASLVIRDGTSRLIEAVEIRQPDAKFIPPSEGTKVPCRFENQFGAEGGYQIVAGSEGTVEFEKGLAVMDPVRLPIKAEEAGSKLSAYPTSYRLVAEPRKACSS